MGAVPDGPSQEEMQTIPETTSSSDGDNQEGQHDPYPLQRSDMRPIAWNFAHY